VYEQVVTATLRSDEAEAFLIVEPFYGAGLAIRHGVSPRNIIFSSAVLLRPTGHTETS
jgi:hypothetical protein